MLITMQIFERIRKQASTTGVLGTEPLEAWYFVPEDEKNQKSKKGGHARIKKNIVH